MGTQTPGPDAPLPPSAQPLAPVEPAPPPGPYGRVPYGPPPAQVAWSAPESETTPKGNWYGWQTLVAVAPIDIAMFVGLANYGSPSGTDAFAMAFTARNLVPSVVHFAHGRPGRAFGSIGLQAASAGAGVAVGYAIGLAIQAKCPPLNPCRNSFLEIPPAAGYGAIGGSMAGTVLNVVFFAHRQRLTWTAAKSEPSWTVAPFAAQHALGMVAGGAL